MKRLRLRRTQRLRLARLRARPRPVDPRWGERLRGAAVVQHANAWAWRIAFLAVFGILVRWSRILGSGYAAAAAVWAIAGAHAWIVATLVQRDIQRRIERHDASDRPSIRGWRLVAGFDDLPPDALVQLDLTLWLSDHARRVWMPIRGHRHGGGRLTYAVPLRDLARRWAADRGMPVRRADDLLHALAENGIVYRVPICNAIAYRLAFADAADSVRALEAWVGPMVDWQLGRDPRWRDTPPDRRRARG